LPTATSNPIAPASQSQKLLETAKMES